MYVCVCKGVTDKQINREIHNGVSNYYDLQERLEVGTCCGQCKDFTMEILHASEAMGLAMAV